MWSALSNKVIGVYTTDYTRHKPTWMIACTDRLIHAGNYTDDYVTNIYTRRLHPKAHPNPNPNPNPNPRTRTVRILLGSP